MKKNKTRNTRTRHHARPVDRRRTTRGRRKSSSFDPSQLINKASGVRTVAPFRASVSYNDLDLHAHLKANLLGKGYELPTEIQERALSPILSGRNLVGVASTGTGKTGAFLIPIIQRLLTENKPFKTLVVVPTRELALQVEQEFRSLTRGTQLYVSSFIGGTNVGRDRKKLQRTNHVIIGTPGRLLDLYTRGDLRLNEITELVLDEFDRMLDMGFIHDIKRLVSGMTRRQQTLLFSATNDKSVEGHVRDLVHDPVEISVNNGAQPTDTVDQRLLHIADGEDKFQKLLDLIRDDAFHKVILFAETKRLVDKLSKNLNRSGVTASHIHGDKTQNFRNRAISHFKQGNSRVLVATDVAARGIDIDDVSHVINYQLPQTMDSYVHRIGRTGRAGKKGVAYTFVG